MLVHDILINVSKMRDVIDVLLKVIWNHNIVAHQQNFHPFGEQLRWTISCQLADFCPIIGHISFNILHLKASDRLFTIPWLLAYNQNPC